MFYLINLQDRLSLYMNALKFFLLFFTDCFNTIDKYPAL